MAEHEGQLGANSSVPDETLRLYLLCRLAQDERLRLDERLLIDDEWAERVLLAESELMDDYSSGRLNAVEREFFETKFLTTDSRRQKLRFTSALHDYAGLQAPSVLASPVAQQEKPSRREGLAVLFGFSRPRAWAVSFAVLVMLVGLAWFIARQRRDTEPVIVRSAPIPSWSPQASPRAEASPTAPISEPQPTPSKKPAAIPTPTEPDAPATVASLVLLPGALRDGGDMQRVALPDGERDIVRLNLILETGSEGVYRAEVATAEGQRVTVRSKLKVNNRTGDPKLTIDIPARLLQSGDYQIKLTRQKTDGQSEAVGRYYFRALD